MITHPALTFLEAYNRLLAVGERLSGRNFTASELTKQIRRQFPVSEYIFVTNRDYSVDPDTVIVSGIFDVTEELDYLPSIEVMLSYHPDQKTYFIDLLNWKQFAFDVAECIGHEMVHKDICCNQTTASLPYISKVTDERKRDEQEYLGVEDEIQAYAFSIAAESEVFKKPFTECVMYGVYRETFDNDNSVIMLLEHHLQTYLTQLGFLNEQTD